MLPNLRRLLVTGVLVLLAAEAAYLGIANAALDSQRVRDAFNRRRARFEIVYDEAWTPFPGLVRVRHLRLRGQTARVQWETTADEAWGVIDLPSLAGKVFRISGLRADGVELR